MSLRVTNRSLFDRNLQNLQTNLSRVQNTQERLSSGKQLRLPSDSPADTGAALRHRSDIVRGEQFARNADDGMGWLTSADSSLTDSLAVMGRFRELLVQASNTGSLDDSSAEAIASEIEGLRGAMLSAANREYLGRPIFAGTADVDKAYEVDGTYNGDGGVVSRTVGPGVSVRVNTTGEEVFGPAGDDVFVFMADIATKIRTDPDGLTAEIATADTHLTRMKNALSNVGARYNQVDTMRTKNDEDITLSRHQLSEVEDIDLPATIVELQLQETAYQAALSATARAVQPSLLDFLR